MDFTGELVTHQPMRRGKTGGLQRPIATHPPQIMHPDQTLDGPGTLKFSGERGDVAPPVQ